MDNVIVFDKPAGITSHDAVSRVKRQYGAKKVGHAGTLDPIATGVLLVCIGQATKISRFLMDLPKQYITTVTFGVRTDTFDAEGKVTEEVEGVQFSADDIKKALGQFTGTIQQAAPAFSAIKRGGKPLYELARKGIEVERPVREVTIHALELLHYEYPICKLKVACSKGTYIRSLADDLGRALGTVAHMSALRRTAVGEFSLSDEPPEAGGPAMEPVMLTVDEALSHLKAVKLEADDYKLVSNGGFASATRYGVQSGSMLRLNDPSGSMFAVGTVREENVKIERKLHLNG